MRFETDVLRLEPRSNGKMVFAARESLWHGYYNSACREAICEAGWLLPARVGTRIIIVFSTTIVSGASLTRYGRLSRAGSVGFQKLCWDTRHDANLSGGTMLWWWPEIVNG